MAQYSVVGRCPVCGDELEVTRLHCPSCDSALEGNFALGRFQRLTREQMQFVETFIKNRGSLKDVGLELGISYPTVVNRLNDVLTALGYTDRVKAAEELVISPEQRKEILDKLAQGKITADQAARLLRGK
ncbi:MAG: DUF2089 domain-containing protein [Chloroflexi bacterium]|nr:DUF2089 domain-containing protein [Chloroflexota bacterium]